MQLKMGLFTCDRPAIPALIVNKARHPLEWIHQPPLWYQRLGPASIDASPSQQQKGMLG